jgi:hypothetical protein
MRSRSNKETRTQAKAQWGTAFDSGDDLSDPPSASESNRPIESDSEVAAKTAEELEINHETVESQDNAKRNRGGRKKKVSRSQSEVLATNLTTMDLFMLLGRSRPRSWD